MKNLVVSSLVAASVISLSNVAQAAGIFFDGSDEFGLSTTFIGGLNKASGNSASTIEAGDAIVLFFCDNNMGTPANIGNSTVDQILDCGAEEANGSAPTSTASASFTNSLGSNNGGFEPLGGIEGKIRSVNQPFAVDIPADPILEDWITAEAPNGTGGTAFFDWDVEFPIIVDFDDALGTDFFEFTLQGKVTRTDVGGATDGLTDTMHFESTFSVEDLFTPDKSVLDFFINEGTTTPPGFVSKSSTASINGDTLVKAPEPSSLLGLASFGILAASQLFKKKSSK